jgi:hypothetical protein
MPAYCTNCGAALAIDTANFCHDCGRPMNTATHQLRPDVNYEELDRLSQRVTDESSIDPHKVWPPFLFCGY